MSVSDYLSVYLTAPTVDEATRIARSLVEGRLAACVNIISSVHSVYRWQDTVEESSEVALIAKTSKACVKALVRQVESMHSYTCPCIVAWPLADGAEGTVAWLRQSLAAPEASLSDPQGSDLQE
jgi:periplasmic divalent cation tolerance protein